MKSTTTSHIQIDNEGVAWIDDTNIKVIEVALEKLAHGLSVEEMYEEHEGYLSLSQIHSALAYYYDHQTEFDREIKSQMEEFERLRAQSLDSPGRRRLRAMGKIL